jgi:hypothetical protein
MFLSEYGAFTGVHRVRALRLLQESEMSATLAVAKVLMGLRDSSRRARPKRLSSKALSKVKSINFFFSSAARPLLEVKTRNLSEARISKSKRRISDLDTFA